jgi:hypothetical protein
VNELEADYAEVMRELDELGVRWLEAHAAGHNTSALADSIVAADKRSRKLERKMRKIGSSKEG